jgi:hypothetical protein
MFRFSTSFRTCNHLTGYAAFSKVSFKMPVMSKVPGGFVNKNKVSHRAWDLLGSKGRAEFSKVGEDAKIAIIKRQKRLEQQKTAQKRASYKYHHQKHPGWKSFVRKYYHSKIIQREPFENRMDLLAEMHETFLREQRRLHNIELREKKRNLSKKK